MKLVGMVPLCLWLEKDIYAANARLPTNFAGNTPYHDLTHSSSALSRPFAVQLYTASMSASFKEDWFLAAYLQHLETWWIWHNLKTVTACECLRIFAVFCQASGLQLSQPEHLPAMWGKLCCPSHSPSPEWCHPHRSVTPPRILGVHQGWLINHQQPLMRPF